MAERYRVIILPRAIGEIEAICTYMDQDSPQNSAGVAQSLVDAIDSLELMPRRNRVHEHRKQPAKTVRSMPVPPFIVYYRVDDVGHAVRVLSVHHGARRQPKRFR